MFETRQTSRRRTRARHGPMAWVLIAVATMWLGGTSQAGERNPRGLRPAEDTPDFATLLRRMPQSPAAQPQREGALQHFQRKLLPRVGFQMESISAFSTTGMPGADIQDHVLYDQMTDAVRAGAKRATRKALKHVLTGALENKINRLRSPVGIGDSGSRADDPRRIRWDVSISSSPDVSMRYRLGQGQMRLRVGVDGGASVSYKVQGNARTEISVGTNGDGAFALSYRVVDF